MSEKDVVYARRNDSFVQHNKENNAEWSRKGGPTKAPLLVMEIARETRPIISESNSLLTTYCMYDDA